LVYWEEEEEEREGWRLPGEGQSPLPKLKKQPLLLRKIQSTKKKPKSVNKSPVLVKHLLQNTSKSEHKESGKTNNDWRSSALLISLSSLSPQRLHHADKSSPKPPRLNPLAALPGLSVSRYDVIFLALTK